MCSLKKDGVQHGDMLNELKLELEYLKDGGTSYRIKTAELALKVAYTITDTDLFDTREKSYETVSNLIPDMDEERLKDVSKLLNVIVRDIYMKANQSDEMAACLANRKRKRKSISLIKVES